MSDDMECTCEDAAIYRKKFKVTPEPNHEPTRQRTHQPDCPDHKVSESDVVRVTTGKDVAMVLVRITGQIVVCAASGVVFGVMAEKSRVFEPASIQGQMLFERFIMVKMFVSAVTSGMFCLSILSILPQTQHRFKQTVQMFGDCVAEKSVMSALIGGSMLGTGLALAGSCPGMVFAQIGTLTQNAWYPFLGGLCGVFVYTFLEPSLTTLLRPTHISTKQFLLDGTGGVYHNYALPFASIMGLSVLALELGVPWTSEVSVPSAWSPILCGAVMGCLQVPVMLAVKDTLGSSSFYCYLLAQLTWIKVLAIKLKYLARYTTGIHNGWQACYMAGVVGGAYISAYTSDTLSIAKGVDPVQGFVGGALMLFGSRLAGGCTSGHGLSGLALLCKLSFVAVPAMFGSGIATAFALRYFNLL